jgi:hypothetical protein
MAIKGAEGMTDRDLAALIDQGARVVVFSYCISVVVITFRRSATVLVRPGQTVSSAGMPYTLLSLLAGWWGFPFGLIFTPIAIMNNLGGGKDVTAQLRPRLGGGSGPAPLGPGSAVRVPWQNGQIYPGTVVEVRPGQLRIRFGNGTEEWVPTEYVRPG